jgi:hypothetical protein
MPARIARIVIPVGRAPAAEPALAGGVQVLEGGGAAGGGAESGIGAGAGAGGGSAGVESSGV